jgi:OmpA-OmpF porin, OOP family
MRALLCAAFLVSSLALADEDAEGTKDHPAVKRYPGSWLLESTEKEFEKFYFPLRGDTGEDSDSKEVEGRYYRAMYGFPEKASCTQILKNYANAFKAAGLSVKQGTGNVPTRTGEITGNGNDWVAGEGKLKGQQVWITQTCNDDPGNHAGGLVVVEAAAMQQKVEITADFLADEIEKNGRVALYGINFATGKADITPDSSKTLATIVELLKKKPDWKLKVEGHTDNVGKPKENLELSKRRAAAVKDWLVKQGIKADRLTTDGFGDGKPLAPNTTDDGRAKNRRVELVKG